MRLRSCLVALLILSGPAASQAHADQDYPNRPSVRQRLAKVGVIVSTLPPAEFGAFIESEIVRWTADVKAAGIEPQ
jgi:hypothetical protein